METKNKPKVVFFDVNETLLDLSKMKKQIGEILNGREDLLPLWFTTMLQYSLVISASGRYEPFAHIGAASLQMVAANQDILISEDDARKVITTGFHDLPAHSEVKEALKQLKQAGYKLVSLTNSSSEGTKKQLERAGLTDYFDEMLSIEPVAKFKPFTDTYNWAASKLETKPQDCMLVAAHGWDVAGALWAGWRAAFVSRPGQQIFPLAPKTEITAPDLKKVADILVTYG